MINQSDFTLTSFFKGYVFQYIKAEIHLELIFYLGTEIHLGDSKKQQKSNKGPEKAGTKLLRFLFPIRLLAFKAAFRYVKASQPRLPFPWTQPQTELQSWFWRPNKR